MKRTKACVGDTLLLNESIINWRDSEVTLREELIYLGQNGQSFFIKYRPVRDGYLIEALSLIIQYQNPTTEAPTEISFRSARMIVNSASNLEIDFAITSEKFLTPPII